MGRSEIWSANVSVQQPNKIWLNTFVYLVQCQDMPYLKKPSLGGDHQDIRIALILHSQQLFYWRTVGTKLEWGAGSPDFPFVGHVTKLVELTIIIGHIISWGIA